MGTLILAITSILATHAQALDVAAEFDNAALKFTGEDTVVGDPRTFSFSNISLVITYVTIVVAALMLAGFLWMAFAYSGRNSGYDYRAKRDTFTHEEDMASKLYSLSQSFRKYQIEDIGCQMYVACEAAKFDRENSKNSFNGLIDDVQGILKPITLDEAKFLPKRLSKLFLAYQEGHLIDTSCNDI